MSKNQGEEGNRNFKRLETRALKLHQKVKEVLRAFQSFYLETVLSPFWEPTGGL